ncbi:MAG: LacI family DNA-binding transcriptional regulator [Bacteroidota bacterium]|nr:LacI family DNA-binding transcriptional regulator [Bacteroidota bacterium]
MAEKANVSIGTVDRVLHSRGEVSETTREKILKIVEELDYKPNLIASALASRKTTKLAILIPRSISEESYWIKPLSGINNALQNYIQYGIEVKFFLFDFFNNKSFEEEGEKLLEWVPQGVIIAPLFYKESINLIGQLKNLSIPYLFIDTNIQDQEQLSFIGQDSFQSGYLSAKLLDICIPSSCSVLIINFSHRIDNPNHLHQREEGFRTYFEQNDPEHKKKLIPLALEDKEDEEFIENLSTLLAESKTIHGIFVTNSKVYRIARLLEKKDLRGIRLIGYDLLPKNTEFLKKGVIDFLINQRPEEQGYNALTTLFDHVVGRKTVEAINFTPIDIITKENIDYQKVF